MKKLKIAVTGGIGTGKSMFCQLLEERNYKVIKADNLAKQLLAEDENIKKNIIREFGAEAYSDGAPDVKYLAEKVFTDPEKVKKINTIIHPATISKIEVLMEETLKQDDLVFVESALIYEAGMEDLFDYVVAVTAEDETRFARVMERDNVSKEEIERRMDNQLSEKYKKDSADFSVDNNGSVEDLNSKTDFLLNLIKAVSMG
ncbi:MAG: dephospho-CoA kinase [Rhodothermaceae bacterium]